MLEANVAGGKFRVKSVRLFAMACDEASIAFVSMSVAAITVLYWVFTRK